MEKETKEDIFLRESKEMVQIKPKIKNKKKSEDE